MDQTTFTLSANTLHCALELSKNSWLLAIQFSGSGAAEPMAPETGGAIGRVRSRDPPIPTGIGRT